MKIVAGENHAIIKWGRERGTHSAIRSCCGDCRSNYSFL